MDKIEVDDLRVMCVVGLYPNERVVPQPLILSLSLEIDTRPATTHGIEGTVDYAQLAGEIRFLMESCEFHLLETAGEAICSYILAPALEGQVQPYISRCSVRMQKPGVISGATPSVTVHRENGEFHYDVQERGVHVFETLYKKPTCTVERIKLNPGAESPNHDEGEDSFELLLSEGFTQDGVPVAAGNGVQHSTTRGAFRNSSEEVAFILRVTRPRSSAGDGAKAMQRYYPEGAYA